MAPHVLFLRVFCDPNGDHGNVLGVVRDGHAFPDERASQALARQRGLSETVFIDDARRGVVDIYTPGVRLPFAGYPLVGVAWLLGLEVLELPVGSIPVRRGDGLTWISARAEWVPPRTLRRYASAQEVDALAVPEPGEWVYAWAWQDEAAGRIRARGFPGRGDGIDEDTGRSISADASARWRIPQAEPAARVPRSGAGSGLRFPLRQLLPSSVWPERPARRGEAGQWPGRSLMSPGCPG